MGDVDQGRGGVRRGSLCRHLGLPVAAARSCPSDPRAVAAAPSPVWGWFAAHPGAGVSTLGRWVPGGVDLAGRWPDGALPVVVVARNDELGLRAAQAAAAAAGPGGEQERRSLLGLVVVRDRAGRMPRELERLARLACSTYQRVWVVPYVRALGRGQRGEAGPPAVLSGLSAELAEMAAAAAVGSGRTGRGEGATTRLAAGRPDGRMGPATPVELVGVRS